MKLTCRWAIALNMMRLFSHLTLFRASSAMKHEARIHSWIIRCTFIAYLFKKPRIENQCHIVLNNFSSQRLFWNFLQSAKEQEERVINITYVFGLYAGISESPPSPELSPSDVSCAIKEEIQFKPNDHMVTITTSNVSCCHLKLSIIRLCRRKRNLMFAKESLARMTSILLKCNTLIEP